MVLSRDSCQAVFRQIAQQPYVDWPAYESSSLFDRSSLPALESDIRVVAEAWFNHNEYEAIEPFIHSLPLAYVQFEAYDCYGGSTSYEMQSLFRLFLLK